MIEMKLEIGTDIYAECRRAVSIANKEGEAVSFCFNQTALVANPGDHADALVSHYWHARGQNKKEKCDDCKGSGWYVGIVERRYCPTCDGSGYL